MIVGANSSELSSGPELAMVPAAPPKGAERTENGRAAAETNDGHADQRGGSRLRWGGRGFALKEVYRVEEAFAFMEGRLSATLSNLRRRNGQLAAVTRQTKALNQLATMAALGAEPAHLARRAALEAMRILPANRVVIRLYDGDGLCQYVASAEVGRGRRHGSRTLLPEEERGAPPISLRHWYNSPALTKENLAAARADAGAGAATAGGEAASSGSRSTKPTAGAPVAPAAAGPRRRASLSLTIEELNEGLKRTNSAPLSGTAKTSKTGDAAAESAANRSGRSAAPPASTATRTAATAPLSPSSRR